jgi:hypothetical protein
MASEEYVLNIVAVGRNHFSDTPLVTVTIFTALG